MPRPAKPLDCQKGPHEQTQSEMCTHVHSKRTQAPETAVASSGFSHRASSFVQVFAISIFISGFFSHPFPSPSKEVTKNSNNVYFYILAAICCMFSPHLHPWPPQTRLIIKFTHVWLNCISASSPEKGSHEEELCGHNSIFQKSESNTLKKKKKYY